MGKIDWDLTKWFSPHLWRQDEPDGSAETKYHRMYGFEGKERPEKVVTATIQEMDSAHLDEHFRDQCAHVILQLQGCLKYDQIFGWYKCKGLKKELHHCYQEELYHDMKEFEREKRLNARERRIDEAAKRNR